MKCNQRCHQEVKESEVEDGVQLGSCLCSDWSRDFSKGGVWEAEYKNYMFEPEERTDRCYYCGGGKDEVLYYDLGNHHTCKVCAKTHGVFRDDYEGGPGGGPY